MLHLNKSKTTLPDVFGITQADVDRLFRITKGFHRNDTIMLSKVIQRVWIDETMSDNVKAWALVELGRWLGKYESEGGF